VAGTPSPVLGSDGLTLLVAMAGAALLVALPWLWRRRGDLPAVRRFSLIGASATAVLGLSIWAGARVASTGGIPLGSRGAGAAVAVVGFAALALGLLGALPWYFHARWGLRSPLVGLFAATTIVFDAFLRVGGETDPIGLFTLLFGPILIVAIALLGGIEYQIVGDRSG
jgi:hypothetical protein